MEVRVKLRKKILYLLIGTILLFPFVKFTYADITKKEQNKQINLKQKQQPRDAEFKYGLGIGSFIFSTDNRKMQPAEFLKRLEKFLNKQTNISDVKINILAEAFRYSRDSQKSFYKPINYYPAFALGNIEFTLYLPEKNQKQLSIIPEWIKPAENEKFYVRIKYDYGLPVAFVKPINITSKYDVSQSIFIVRKYIESIIKDSSEDVKFRIQGPSPAHVDVYVFANKQLKDIIAYEYNEAEGYNRINVFYNPNKITENESMEYIFYSSAGILGEYYLWEARKGFIMLEVNEFYKIYGLLLKISEKTAFFDILSKYYFLPKLIQKSFLKLSEYV